MKLSILTGIVTASTIAASAACRHAMIERSAGSIVPDGVEATELQRFSQRTTAIFEATSVRWDSTLRADHGATLAEFGEPGFEAFADSSDTEAAWFGWFRTFHHPIVVRVTRRGASYALTGVELDGASGYRHGKVIHRDSTAIDAAQWRALTAPLRTTDFWNTKPSDMVGLDGATWIVAASSNRRVYVTERWSPEERGPDAQVRAFGLAMLRAAKLDREPIY